MISENPWRPFIDAPRTILGAFFLFAMAIMLGQILASFTQADPADFGFIGIPFTFAMAACSGLGLIFLIIDLVCLFQFIYTDKSRFQIFFIVAACQLAMCFSIWLVFDRENPAAFLTRGLIASLALAGLYSAATRIYHPHLPHAPRLSSFPARVPPHADADATEETHPVRCPCCAYHTITKRAGFELCPVCWWEDDGQDDHNADEIHGGPNGNLSLAEARSNYLLCGAAHPRFLPKVRPHKPEEV
ncbi:hypothetical protein BH09VER1_BH09VER1_51490 [soil metagenome]